MEHRHDYYWYCDTNEAGWGCAGANACGAERPGEPPGFSPQLDREEIERKVHAISVDMHDAKIIYVSNSDMGERLARYVVERCKRENVFDQYSIAFFILAELAPQHAKYWSEISAGVLGGKDARDRCDCGALATVYQAGRMYCSKDAPSW